VPITSNNKNRMGHFLLASVMLVAGTLATAQDAAVPAAVEPSAEALAFNCYTCHGPGGVSPAAMPSLHGKSANYLLRRLQEFKQDKGNPTIMGRIAKGYSDEELARIAEYLASDH
jgi:sulfide dehydrogenase cytochrome subunit